MYVDYIAYKLNKVRKPFKIYYWHEYQLYYKYLMVPKLEERKKIIWDLHEEIEHLGEKNMLVETCTRFVWHDITNSM